MPGSTGLQKAISEVASSLAKKKILSKSLLIDTLLRDHGDLIIIHLDEITRAGLHKAANDAVSLKNRFKENKDQIEIFYEYPYIPKFIKIPKYIRIITGDPEFLPAENVSIRTLRLLVEQDEQRKKPKNKSVDSYRRIIKSATDANFDDDATAKDVLGK